MRFPAFMFWPERYWLDTYDLSDAEHGRYLRVLIVMWNAPRCRIPNDPAWIAAKTGRSVEAFEIEIKPILLRFCKTDGNCWWQVKLLAEYERCERLSSRGSAGGKALANKKKGFSQTPARDSQQAHAPTPTPTPTLEEERKSPASAADAALPDDLKRQLFERGRRVLGERDGGSLTAKLLKAKDGNVAKARAALEQASEADRPKAYLMRIINGQPSTTEGPQWRENLGPIV